MGNVIAAGFRRVRGWHAPLAWFGASMAALAAVSAVGMGVDDRMLVGAPIWAKPLKFSLSFVAYSVTLAWLVAQLPRARRLAWWTGTVIVVASAIEMIVIVGQVLRGRQSHFNITTSLDASLFSIMAVTIAVLYVANLLVAFMLLRSRLADPVTTWAVRLGVIIALGGMAVGFLMVGPTPEQAQALAAGQTTLSGAHSVGVADGGPGLPLVGWSTTGGDLADRSLRRHARAAGAAAARDGPHRATGTATSGARAGAARRRGSGRVRRGYRTDHLAGPARAAPAGPRLHHPRRARRLGRPHRDRRRRGGPLVPRRTWRRHHLTPRRPR
jgi:uncharacterized membrane protein YhaH (DUF805 family)